MRKLSSDDISGIVHRFTAIASYTSAVLLRDFKETLSHEDRTLCECIIFSIADLFAQTLLGFFDMLMVGRLGPEAISSVGVGNAPLNAVTPIFFAVSIGTTALVSRAYGSRDRKEGKNALAQSLILSIPISLGITLLLFIFREKTLELVGRADDMNLVMTNQYYSTVLLGMPFLCFNVVFFAAYRSISKANMPMIANILSIFLIFYLTIYLFSYLVGE